LGRRAIVEQLAADRDLACRHELLVSIPGIDTATAATILAELPDIRILRAPAK
jgi:transposase